MMKTNKLIESDNYIIHIACKQTALGHIDDHAAHHNYTVKQQLID